MCRVIILLVRRVLLMYVRLFDLIVSIGRVLRLRRLGLVRSLGLMNVGLSTSLVSLILRILRVCGVLMCETLLSRILNFRI